MASRWCVLYKGTPAEHALEPAVAALGHPYRTQFPMFLYTGLKSFLDFYIPDLRLCIEVDDDSHKRKKAADALRTAALNELGIVVVRCTNEEALTDPTATVARLLAEAERLRGQCPAQDSMPVLLPRKRVAKRSKAASSPGKRAAPRKAVARPTDTPF